MLIEFDGDKYPELQTEGNAAQWCMPFAQKILKEKTRGMDIGCNREEWSYPGSVLVDSEMEDDWHAFNLPMSDAEYIFSSHCLEHIPDWTGALNHWKDHMIDGAILFLYLPHYDQKYWRPWNNRKHVNALEPKHLRDYFQSTQWTNYIVTEGYDLNHSFYAIAVK